jgi:hypothetical protein
MTKFAIFAFGMLPGTARAVGGAAILRLYGPAELVINKSWKPGDIEELK